MEDFISAIFSNIFIVGAILYGIYSLFRNMQEGREKEGEEKPSPSSKEKRKTSPTLEEQYNQMKNNQQSDQKGESVQVDTSSPREHDAILDHGDLVVEKQGEESMTAHPFIERKWTKKRLREGVIMSEILATPV